MQKLGSLSRREREIMDIVYRAGAAAASEVRGAMAAPPSDSAVRTTLRILETKGLLTHEFDGKRYVYRPRVHRDKVRRGALDHVLRTFFDGSAAGAVVTLLERPGLKLSKAEVERLAVLIDRARKGGR